MRSPSILRLLGCALLILPTACLPKAKLTRWYSEADLSQMGVAGPTTLGATLHATSISPEARASASTSVSSLGPEGQQAWIEAVAKVDGVSKSAGSLAAAVATPIRQPPTRSTRIDQTVASRRMVITFETNFLPPSDRIARTELTIRPTNPKHLEFVGWQQLATQYASIDLGKISSDQKNTFSLSDLLKIPQVSEVADSGADLSFERKLAEEVVLKSRFRTFSGRLSPGSIEIVQEGSAGLDLQGNTVFEFSARVHPDEVSQAFVKGFEALIKDGKPIPAKDVKVSEALVLFTTNPGSLNLDVELELEYFARLVAKGAKTQIEGDDEVTFKREKVKTTAPIFEPSDYNVQLWALEQNRVAVAIEVPRRAVASYEDLVFSSYDSAQEFLWWANEVNAMDVGGLDLRLSCGVPTVSCGHPDFKNPFDLVPLQQ